jgi:hypothetical protein
MRRCIAVLVAAVALALSASLAAQAPEATQPTAHEGLGQPPAQSRPIRPPAGSPAKPPPAAAIRPIVRPPAVAVTRPLRIPIERIDEARKASIKALDLQTDFPRRFEPVRIPIPGEIIWILVIVVVALVLYSMRDTLLALLGRPNQGWDEPAAGAGEGGELGAGLDALAAADRMSHDGRFVEAMHMLLLQSLTDIREHLRETFADSLTSREILRGARLEPAGRTPLREIIAVVERTYFGGYPAQADDYAACRRNFDTLRRALRGGAPA